MVDEYYVKYELYWKVGYIINVFFEEFVEDMLNELIFVYGYLVEILLLVKKNEEDLWFIDCFEFFILGNEYVNVFSELNDLID